MTAARANIPEPATLTDDETFDLMVDAFTDGLIEANERIPILRLFGRSELYFCLKLANTPAGGDPDIKVEVQGTTVHLSVEVQERLLSHFAPLLSAH